MSRSLDFFFSCSCWILAGVGCLMEEVKAPLAWAWDLPQKAPQQHSAGLASPPVGAMQERWTEIHGDCQ